MLLLVFIRPAEAQKNQSGFGVTAGLEILNLQAALPVEFNSSLSVFGSPLYLNTGGGFILTDTNSDDPLESARVNAGFGLGTSAGTGLLVAGPTAMLTSITGDQRLFIGPEFKVIDDVGFVVSIGGGYDVLNTEQDINHTLFIKIGYGSLF
jgi:hypothetical protein